MGDGVWDFDVVGVWMGILMGGGFLEGRKCREVRFRKEIQLMQRMRQIFGKE